MDDPILTIEEREAINSGRWFSSLSPALRHDILRCAYVKRFKDSELKRINSLLCSVAYPILESAGALAPSRLRTLNEQS